MLLPSCGVFLSDTPTSTVPPGMASTNPFAPNFVAPGAAAVAQGGAGNFNEFNDDDDIFFEEFVRLRTTGETDA